MNSFFKNAAKWVAMQILPAYFTRILRRYMFRRSFRDDCRKKRISDHDHVLLEYGDELINEFITNGYSAQEEKIARKIRNYMQKHDLL
jgi:hypothetical protein